MATRMIESVNPDDVWTRDDGTKFIVQTSRRIPVCKHGDRLIAMYSPTIVATLCMTDLNKQQYDDFKQELLKVLPHLDVDRGRVKEMIEVASVS